MMTDKKNMSFQERSKLAQELLSKQGPVTLDYARAQVLWIKFHSANKNKEEDIKNHLVMYHPDWTKDQIDNEYIRLLEIKNLGIKEAVIFINNKK